jgi:hypothetical protein
MSTFDLVAAVDKELEGLIKDRVFSTLRQYFRSGELIGDLYLYVWIHSEER